MQQNIQYGREVEAHWKMWRRFVHFSVVTALLCILTLLMLALFLL